MTPQGRGMAGSEAGGHLHVVTGMAVVNSLLVLAEASKCDPLSVTDKYWKEVILRNFDQ